MSITAYILAWFGINSGIWFLFVKLEETLRPEIKTDISNWLRNLNLEGKLANWPTAFASVFDGIFGKKHFSWRCFSRSCIASILAVLILTILWWAVHPEMVYSCFKAHGNLVSMVWILLITSLINLIPDYFSLLETRYIIRKCINANSTAKTFGFLVIDFVATIFIFLTGIIICISILVIYDKITGIGNLGTILDEYLRFIPIIYHGLTLSTEDPKANGFTFGLWFYSTFFTSVWIYLYIISGLIVKAGSFIGILASCIRKIFDIDKKPLRSMGYVSIAFVSLIFLIVPFAKLLF